MAHICFILHPKFQMLAYVLATETLRIANRGLPRAPAFTWETRSATQVPVEASNGMQVWPDVRGWADGTPCDLVLICAGYDPLAIQPPGLKAYLSRAARAGAVLGGLDTGVSILASLGLLGGCRVVLHHEAEAGFREAWPNIPVSDDIYCLDGKRLSAAGGTATSDAVLAWISAAVSTELAEQVAEDMAHGTIRPAGERQRLSHMRDPVLTMMRDMMLAHGIIPIRRNGRAWKEDSPAAIARNEILRATRYLGRALWRKWAEYHVRSRVETRMNCLKLFGERIMSRDPDRQTAEIQTRIAIMNRFNALGTAEIEAVA